MTTTLDAEGNNFLSRLNSASISSDRGRLIRSVSCCFIVYVAEEIEVKPPLKIRQVVTEIINLS